MASSLRFKIHANPVDDVFQPAPVSPKLSPIRHQTTFLPTAIENEKAVKPNDAPTAGSPCSSKNSPRTPKGQVKSAGSKSTSPIKRAFNAAVRVLTSPCRLNSSPASETHDNLENNVRGAEEISPAQERRLASAEMLSNTGMQVPDLDPTSLANGPDGGKRNQAKRVSNILNKTDMKENISMVHSSDDDWPTFGPSTSTPPSHRQDSTRSPWNENCSPASWTTYSGSSNCTLFEIEESEQEQIGDPATHGSTLHGFPTPPRRRQAARSSPKLSLGQMSTFDVDFGLDSKRAARGVVPGPLFSGRMPNSATHHQRRTSSTSQANMTPCDLSHSLRHALEPAPPAVLNTSTHQRQHSSTSFRRSGRRVQASAYHHRNRRPSAHKLSIGQISTFECDFGSVQQENIVSRPTSRSSSHFRKTRRPSIHVRPGEYMAQHLIRRSKQFRHPYMSSIGNISVDYSERASTICSSILDENVLTNPSTNTSVSTDFEERQSPRVYTNFSRKNEPRGQRIICGDVKDQSGTLFMAVSEMGTGSHEGSQTVPVGRPRWGSVYLGAMAEYLKPTRATVVTIPRQAQRPLQQ